MFERILTRLVYTAFTVIILLATCERAKADLTYKTYAGTGA
jgi:hypothetical protein